MRRLVARREVGIVWMVASRLFHVTQDLVTLCGGVPIGTLRRDGCGNLCITVRLRCRCASSGLPCAFRWSAKIHLWCIVWLMRGAMQRVHAGEFQFRRLIPGSDGASAGIMECALDAVITIFPNVCPIVLPVFQRLMNLRGVFSRLLYGCLARCGGFGCALPLQSTRFHTGLRAVMRHALPCAFACAANGGDNLI